MIFKFFIFYEDNDFLLVSFIQILFFEENCIRNDFLKLKLLYDNNVCLYFLDNCNYKKIKMNELLIKIRYIVCFFKRFNFKFVYF